MLAPMTTFSDRPLARRLDTRGVTLPLVSLREVLDAAERTGA
jgi:hypothetical protein